MAGGVSGFGVRLGLRLHLCGLFQDVRDAVLASFDDIVPKLKDELLLERLALLAELATRRRVRLLPLPAAMNHLLLGLPPKQRLLPQRLCTAPCSIVYRRLDCSPRSCSFAV